MKMNTVALELKINAVTIIQALTRHAGHSYEEYVDKTLELIVELIGYPYSYTVRKASWKTVDHLLMCCTQ